MTDFGTLLEKLNARHLDDDTVSEFYRLGSTAFWKIIALLEAPQALTSRQVSRCLDIAFKLREQGNRERLTRVILALAKDDSRRAVREKAVTMILGWRAMSREYKFEVVGGITNVSVSSALERAVSSGMRRSLRQRVRTALAEIAREGATCCE